MKTIVVRAPNWLGDVVMSLPFLHGLNHAFSDSQIHVVIKQEHAPVLELLPDEIKLRIHFYDKKNHPNVFSLKRYCRELRTETGPIDAYFALPPSFSSSIMGFFLGGRERIGYSYQNRGLFFTKSVPMPANMHRAYEYYQLLSAYAGKIQDFPKWRTASGVWANRPADRYIVINPNSIATSRRLPLSKWLDLIAHYSDTDFVVVGGPSEEAHVAELMGMLETQYPENRYLNMAGKTSIAELITVLKGSAGCISNDSGPAHVAHMLGVPTVVFFGAGAYRNTGPTYASGNTMIVSEEMDCSPCLKNYCPLETVACLSNLNTASRGPEIKAFLEDHTEPRSAILQLENDRVAL